MVQKNQNQNSRRLRKSLKKNNHSMKSIPYLISRTSLTKKENYLKLNNTRMIKGMLYGKHLIFQMVRMMIDGIIGALITGGTKWDADMHDIEYQDSEILELTFNTAWSPPEGVMEKLREKYPELSFQCFYDEPGCEISGYY